jgi:hypothetical protein
MMADFLLARSDVIGDPPAPAPGDADAGVASARPESASLTAEEKRKLIAKQLLTTPEKSNRQLAAVVGVTHKVVAVARTKLEATGQIAQLTARSGKDGKTRTAKPQQAAAQGGRKVNSHTFASQPPAAESNGQQVQPATAEDMRNQQTILQLALRICAATVAERVLGEMAALVDELLESHLLDDDDEEGDENWLDDHHKREKKLLDEAITDAVDKYPDIDAVNNLPPSSDPKIARDAEQLKDALTRCPIGATELKEKFSQSQLKRMVKRDLKRRFEEDPKYGRYQPSENPISPPAD